MNSNSILRITDCLTTINLLSIYDGYLVCDWVPAVAQLKNGGVWQSSPLMDGKRLSSRNFDNAVETFTLTIKGASQDAVIDFIQSLTTMLEKATSYWTTAWQKQPVWLEARGATETNIRYAVIKGYKIEEIANPFSQPFFGNCKSLISKFVVVIERDHWLDQIPGTAHRIDINNQQTYVGSTVGSDVSACSQSGDDAIMYGYYGQVNRGGVEINKMFNRVGQATTPDAGENIVLGETKTYQTGLRFPSVAVPQGATITNAYITLGVPANAGSEEDDPIGLQIRGELTPNATVFTGNYWDFAWRWSRLTLATLQLAYNPHTWSNVSQTQIINVSSIVQEIVEQYGWVSGNALVLLMTGGSYYSGQEGYLDFDSFDSGTPPSLTVTYTMPPAVMSTGHEDTDTGNVYVANKNVQAQLTHIFYNDVGVGYSGNLIGTALPWALLPAVPATGDEICFGISNDVANYGPFDSLALDISVAGTGFSLGWYYNHAVNGWTYTYGWGEKSSSLDQTGEFIVHLNLSTQGATTINGVTGYWIKAVVTLTGGPATPPYQANRQIYTVNSSFVDIDSSNIKGEIPALARIRMKSSPLESIYATNIAVGLRSKSRGEDFSAYLNYSDVQIQNGIYAMGNFTADADAPTGRVSYITSTVLEDEWVQSYPALYIYNTVSSQYQGMFHAFLRVKQITGNYGDFTLRLNYTLGNLFFPSKCPAVVVPAGVGSTLNVLDYGLINLGTSSLGYDDNLGTVIFIFEYKHNVATQSTVEIVDLILIPCDEWMGFFKSPTPFKTYMPNVLTQGNILDIDATGNPRLSRAILRLDNEADVGELNEQFISEYVKMTRGGPFLQVNSDQRLWFSTYYEDEDADGNYIAVAYPQALYSIRTYVANRYLTMRGAI